MSNQHLFSEFERCDSLLAAHTGKMIEEHNKRLATDPITVSPRETESEAYLTPAGLTRFFSTIGKPAVGTEEFQNRQIRYGFPVRDTTAFKIRKALVSQRATPFKQQTRLANAWLTHHANDTPT
jgi:hypothetical protein